MDDLNITMEEYIRIEEEKAQKSRKVFNWETAKISFDESDDEDYTVVFDKNSFSYKIIYANDLKTDSKNDNEKVNMPSFLPPEPTISCFDDLDFFNDFENEFPAIVNNDALTSKLDFLTKPTIIYTAYPNPMDTAYYPSGRYPVFIFSTVYTAYSLNEYSVYNTGINTAYPGVWIRRIDFVYSLDLMRQKNKRMKQEGLIRHYGILQKMEDSTRYAKEGNKINIEGLLKKIKTKLMLIEDKLQLGD
ncbi:hypothetical protein Tco_0685259 [Tanacetum coccineum]